MKRFCFRFQFLYSAFFLSQDHTPPMPAVIVLFNYFLDKESEAAFDIRLYDAVIHLKKRNDRICKILSIIRMDWNGGSRRIDEVCIFIFKVLAT